MDKKIILIAIVIVAVIAVIGGFFLFNNGDGGAVADIATEHSTIVLSKSAYMEVPKNPNATNKVDKKGIFRYNDKQDDLNITSCSNLSADSSAKEMKKLKNSVATGAKKIKENNVVIYEKNGTYSVFVKNTEYNDTLLIQSPNKNLLLQCWETVQYHDPTHKIKFNDTDDSGSGSGNIVDAVEKTEKAVQQSSSTSSSSSSSSSTSGTGSGGYSDFGFGGSSSSSGGYSRADGSSGEGYADFGF
ncbi:hypothetical protein [Methanobrevibacter sp.]